MVGAVGKYKEKSVICCSYGEKNTYLKSLFCSVGVECPNDDRHWGGNLFLLVVSEKCMEEVTSGNREIFKCIL